MNGIIFAAVLVKGKDQSIKTDCRCAHSTTERADMALHSMRVLKYGKRGTEQNMSYLRRRRKMSNNYENKSSADKKEFDSVFFVMASSLYFAGMDEKYFMDGSIEMCRIFGVSPDYLKEHAEKLCNDKHGDIRDAANRLISELNLK